MNTISRFTQRAAQGACVAAILAGCSSGANSPAGFTPTGAKASYGPGPHSSANAKAGIAHYYVVRLRTLGGGASVANSINNHGWIAGISRVQGNAAVHAVLWVNGRKVNLGTLGGPNSGVGWPVKNDRGQLVGISDLAKTDPLAENFCGFGSPNLCAGFLWKNKVLTALPTLGGNNSFAAGVNESGQIIGFAENAVQDSNCGSPQLLDYYATIWTRDRGPRSLPPLAGDSVSQAVAINNAGAAVGASGPCGPPDNLGYGTAHALLWPRSRKPMDLGNLGGTTANLATAINDRGDVVGQSALTGNTTYHAFWWRNGAITDLGTLPGDALSEALGLNNKRQAVGYSCDTGGNCRGFIWQNGAMSDLNLLVPRSRWYIVYAGDINDQGWIVGQAVDVKTSKAMAVLLIPSGGSAVTTQQGDKITLPQSVRRQEVQHRGFRIFFE